MHATPTAETAGAGFELGPWLLGETADIDLARRPHCRGQAPPLDVGALDAAWLAPSDRADKGAHIIDERVLRKARFADTGMDDPGLLGAELDLAAFDRLDGLGHVLRYRAETRVRHQPARPQDLPKPADHRHHVRCRDSAVEVDFAGLHLLGQVFRADDVGAGGFRLLGAVAASKHRDPYALAGAMRQHDGAAQVLVGLARIEVQVHRDLDGLVEFRRGPRFDLLDRVLELHWRRCRVEPFIGFFEAFAGFCHASLRPLFDDFKAHRPRRADHHLARRIEVVGIEILHLLFGDVADLRHRDPPDRVALAGRLRAFLDPRRFLEKKARWRRLRHEGEAAIAIGGDHDRDRHAGFEVLSLGVERLAELHDVEAALAQRRPDRRGRVR